MKMRVLRIRVECSRVAVPGVISPYNVEHIFRIEHANTVLAVSLDAGIDIPVEPGPEHLFKTLFEHVHRIELNAIAWLHVTFRSNMYRHTGTAPLFQQVLPRGRRCQITFFQEKHAVPVL